MSMIYTHSVPIVRHRIPQGDENLYLIVESETKKVSVSYPNPGTPRSHQGWALACRLVNQLLTYESPDSLVKLLESTPGNLAQQLHKVLLCDSNC